MSLDTEKYRRNIENSFDELSTISDKDSSVGLSKMKWSSKEIIGHLIVSCSINTNRLYHALKKDDLVFDEYPQDEYVRIQKYNLREWKELINLWKLNNLQLINLVENIPDAKVIRSTYAHNFDKICWSKLADNKKSNLEYLIKDYFNHIEHHLNQIFNDK